MRIYNEQLDETLLFGGLQNGLKYYIIPKTGYTEKRALLTVKYGSVDTAFKAGGKAYKTPLGTAHFLEHKLFDNETGSAFDEFSRLGAFANAYTSFNNTAYYFSCAEGFEDCLKTLVNFVSAPYFTEKSVEKEMGIISQEISMYDDNPGWAVYFDMLSCLYEAHPAKDSPAGTRQSISEISGGTLDMCYNNFYVPENMHLICAGGIDERERQIIAETAECFPKSGKRAETLLPDERVSVHRFESARKMNVSRPVFQLGFKDTRFENLPERACAFKIMLDMFIGESSPLKGTLADKQLADDSLSFDYIYGDKYGYATISGESAKPRALLELCSDAAAKIMKNGFAREDFERIKRKHIGRFIKGFNSIEAITAAFAEYAAKGSNLFDCLNGYNTVELELCESLLAECFRDGGFAVSVIEPL